MGYWKEYEIMKMEDPFFDLPSHPVGISSFENRLLRDFVATYGDIDICHYSGNHELCVPFSDVVRIIHSIVETYFEDPANEAGWDSHFDEGEEIPGFSKLGGGYIVPSSKPHYDNIEELLYDESFEVNSESLFKDIADSLPDHLFVEKDLYGLNEAEERTLDWREIDRKSIEWKKQGITYTNLPISDKTRFFNLLETIQSLAHKLLKREALILYRVVNYDDILPEVKFSDLTSPPLEYTSDLRMSCKGESMFYGASSRECALEEATGSTARYAYVGEFVSQHPMVLLDLRKVHDRISIFDVSQSDYYAMIFLRHFARVISKPVADENKEAYSPTQFMTGFFRDCLNLYNPDGTKSSLDGILYDSSKVGSDYNAVLFFDNPASASHLKLNTYVIIDRSHA